MNHGSLFSGIGGPELAAEWMGWNNVFHCEINPFGKQVLNYYWPNSICYDDIKKTDFSIHRGTIDILTGGFPCQPYSAAGKRKGKDDERHLWPEMLRAIREIQPTWVVGENVYGLVNWNGGLVFNEVQTDLEVEGYEIQPVILPACAVGAPHRRERVWFVAYSNKCTTGPSGKSERIIGSRGNNNDEQEEWRKQAKQRVGYGNVYGNDTNSIDKRLQRIELNGTFEQDKAWKQAHRSTTKFYKAEYWRNFPTQSPVCSGDDGLSSKLVGITVPKHRTESIKAYGNAIVPQVIHQIFKSIAEYENLYNENSYNQK